MEKTINDEGTTKTDAGAYLRMQMERTEGLAASAYSCPGCSQWVLVAHRDEGRWNGLQEHARQCGTVASGMQWIAGLAELPTGIREADLPTIIEIQAKPLK